MTCSKYDGFIFKAGQLASKLLLKVYNTECPRSLYDLVKTLEVRLSRMIWVILNCDLEAIWQIERVDI